MREEKEKDKEGTLEDGAMAAVAEGQPAERGGGQTAGGGEGQGEASGELGSRRGEQHFLRRSAKDER